MSSKLLKLVKSKEFLVFAIAFILITFFQTNFITDLSASRIMTIEALVEHQTFAIDDIEFFKTIDKIYYNNHFYSSKPPFVSIIGAGAYFLYKLFTNSEFGLPAYFVIKLFTVILPFSLLLLFFYKSLKWQDIPKVTRFIIPFFLGFATLLFPYSVILQNHTMSAFLIFLSFYCILKNRFDGYKKYLVFLAGFFASLSVTTEFVQSSLILFIFFLYLIFSLKNKKDIKWFILGCAPVAILYILYNIHTTGSILPPYANFNSLYSYENSYWNNPTGVDAFSHPKWLYFLNMIVGTHGLLLYSPVLALGLVGLYRQIKDKKDKFHDIALMAGSAILLVILVIGFFTYNYGGTTFGMRWLIILYPLIMFFSLPVFANTKKLIPIVLLSAVIIFSVIVNYKGMHHKWTPSSFTINGIEMTSPFLDSFNH
ncbi:MAG: hypothetical protein Q8P20_05120 [bacterium]|nr:hypothetical protein [bacterium]